MPSPERFCELLHPNVRLTQPLSPPIIGKPAAHEEFRRLLRWLPDLVGRVEQSGDDSGTLIIDLVLSFSLSKTRILLPVADRILVEDGLIRERRAHFDAAFLLRAVACRPGGWGGYWSYRFG